MAVQLHAHVDPLTKLSETKKSQTEAIKNERGKVGNMTNCDVGHGLRHLTTME